MSCLIDARNEINNLIRKTEFLISKVGNTTTSDGEHLGLTLERYKKALEAPTKEEAFKALASMANTDVFHTEARANIGDKLKGSITRGASFPESEEYNLYKATLHGDMAKLVVEKEGKFYTFSFPITGNPSVTSEPVDGVRMKLDTAGIGLNWARNKVRDIRADKDRAENAEARRAQVDAFLKLLASTEEAIGTDSDKLVDLADYTKVDYTHGTVEAMKDLIEKLDVMGTNRASPEYLSRMKDLFSAMHPRFFNEMEVYIKEAADTTGFMSASKNAIILDIGTNKSFRSNAEAYAHEVVHAMTYWAWRQESVEANKLRRQVRYTLRQALDNTKWEDFLEVEESQATQAQKNAAQELFDRVFNSKNAEEEFLANSLTNPIVMKHMESINIKSKEKEAETLLEKVVDFFKSLMDAVLGKYNFKDRGRSVQEQVAALAMKLGEINANHEEKIGKLNPLAQLWEAVNIYDEKIHFAVEKAVEKLVSKGTKYPPYPSNAGKVAQTFYVLRYLAHSFVNPQFRASLGTQWLGNTLGIKADSSFREFVATLFEESSYKQAMNWLGLQDKKIDTARNSTINQTVTTIKEAFVIKRSKEEEEAITEVLLDTNVSALLNNGYSLGQIQQVLLDRNTLNKKLDAARAKLASLVSKGQVNYMLNQAEGLGFYMATHLGSVAQNLNSTNIARAIGVLDTPQAPNPEVVKAIDEVASLFALLHTKQESKSMVAALFINESEAITTILDMYESFKQQSRETLFEGSDVMMIDGYTKEIFDDTIDIKFAKLSDRKQLEAEGYTYKGRAAPIAGGLQPYGVFVTDSFARAERLKGNISLGGNHARGTGLKETVFRDSSKSNTVAWSDFERSMRVVSRERSALILKMTKERVDVTRVADGRLATLNSEGHVSDFRATMGKEWKKELLKQRSEVSEVLGRSMGSIIDKSRREEQNQRVLDLVVEDMENNWEGTAIGAKDNGLLEYTIINANSPDKEIRELFYLLPRSWREYAESRKDKSIAIPTELMNITFGYSHARASGLLSWAQKKAPNNKVVEKVAPAIKRVVDLIGSYWIDLIKIVKGNILLKMPVFLVSNIVSNIIYGFNTGMSLTEIIKMYGESFADVRAFMQNNRRKIKLELALGKDKVAYSRNPTKELETKIRRAEIELGRIKVEMDGNPVKELFDLGMYQSVVEDVETSKLNDSNKITDKFDSVLENVPKVVKLPLQWLYLSKETSWYQINQEVLQMSDLIARDVMNRKQKVIELEQANGIRDLPLEFRNEMRKQAKLYKPKEKLEGARREEFLKFARESRQYNLLKNFINYNQPNGKAEEYLNRIGLLMFTKYVKNIQRVLMHTGSRHPIKTAFTVLAAGAFLNADYVQEQAFLVKGWQGGDFSLEHIFPVYDPVSNFMTAITPPLVHLVT